MGVADKLNRAELQSHRGSRANCRDSFQDSANIPLSTRSPRAIHLSIPHIWGAPEIATESPFRMGSGRMYVSKSISYITDSVGQILYTPLPSEESDIRPHKGGCVKA
jgi:hypothetical protein